MSALLWGGSDAAISHGTAAALWRFAEVRGRRAVELWVPTKRRIRSDSVIVHRGPTLEGEDLSNVGPISITSPLRTLIDVSGRLEDDRLLAVAEDLIRQRLVNPEHLTRRVNALRASGRTGTGRLATLLGTRGDGRPLESALEGVAWMLIRESGLPLPARQYWVVLAGNRYRLDFAWRERKLGLECEGRQFHEGSRWGKNQDRFAEFAAAGWAVLPVTWNACRHDSQRVIRWLRDAYATRPDRFGAP
ncbi:MAG TPA: hypothetical protein VEP49_11010 [Acidimicrobiia bacterium]|nr:hypothetical protein [Acidimicrobiia bacterium]